MNRKNRMMNGNNTRRESQFGNALLLNGGLGAMMSAKPID
jgi:hypothetical protein